jgi:hypothetical protein
VRGSETKQGMDSGFGMGKNSQPIKPRRLESPATDVTLVLPGWKDDDSVRQPGATLHTAQTRAAPAPASSGTVKVQKTGRALPEIPARYLVAARVLAGRLCTPLVSRL